MNKVILAGRLTKVPDLRQTTSGVAICNFAIAVSRAYKNADRRILLACQVCWADHRDAVLRDWRSTVRKRGKGE